MKTTYDICLKLQAMFINKIVLFSCYICISCFKIQLILRKSITLFFNIKHQNYLFYSIFDRSKFFLYFLTETWMFSSINVLHDLTYIWRCTEKTWIRPCSVTQIITATEACLWSYNCMEGMILYEQLRFGLREIT